MTNTVYRSWLECVSLHPDVVADTFSEDIFALDLGPLSDYIQGINLGVSPNQLPTVPAVYRDAESFFRASYLTAGLQQLLSDVLGRLSGSQGNRILKLVTPFGGGKSHTLAALLHATQSPQALRLLPEAANLPKVTGAHVAVVDGQFFDAKVGKRVPNEAWRARTIWGWIAWSLAGEAGYNLIKDQDISCIAPGADELVQILSLHPSLILLDEMLEYLISAGGIRIEQTTLRDETLSFLKRLCVAVGNVDRAVMVFSLQSSKRESLEYANLLQTVDHLAARKDQRREPVEGNEILKVIQRRLLAEPPNEQFASQAASGYQHLVAQMRRAYATEEAERQQAEEEAISLGSRIRSAYPFHPALIDIMRERWAAIPDFQRTRGALRFLAACLRAAHREGRSRILLGPGDAALQNPDVRLAFFKEVGQQSDFQAVLEHDFTGANARVKRIDDRRARETPSEYGKNAASRIATAILLNSFGGLRRGGESSELLPPGISEQELMSIMIAPDLDSTTIQACLKELRETCLYLHFDGARYCFKKDPNITLLIEQETDSIARDDAITRRRIQDLLEERLGGRKGVILWPTSPADLPDNEPQFILAYLPLEFAAKTDKEKEAIEFFETGRGKARQFRNGCGLVVPSADQIEGLRRSVRYLIAAERVKTKAHELNLTDAQKSQLREREATERAVAESAILKLYGEVWLPKLEGTTIRIEAVSVGGRPLQTTLDEKRRALIHERVIELLTAVTQKVFMVMKPSKVIELFGLGSETANECRVRVAEVSNGFFSFLGYPRILNIDVIRHAISRGVELGDFAYVLGDVEIGSDRKCKIERNRIVFRRTLNADEIDCEVGTIVRPSAIPEESRPPESVGSVAGVGQVPGADEKANGGPATGILGDVGRRTDPIQKSVEISFLVNRTQLYEAWAALANLADLAGKVDVSVRAVSESGFDQTKLENGVFEPLREMKLLE